MASTRAGTEQRRCHAEDTGAGADVEHPAAAAPLHHLPDQGQTQAGRGMVAGAEGHAGVHHDDPLARCRLVLLPGRSDDQTGDDGEGDEMLLPVAAPVLLGIFGDGQGRLLYLEDLRQFGEIVPDLADDPAALSLLHIRLGQVGSETLPTVPVVDIDLDRRFGHPQQEITDRINQHRIGAD